MVISEVAAFCLVRHKNVGEAWTPPGIHPPKNRPEFKKSSTSLSRSTGSQGRHYDAGAKDLPFM